jgi:hypothetical protein
VAGLCCGSAGIRQKVGAKKGPAGSLAGGAVTLTAEILRTLELEPEQHDYTTIRSLLSPKLAVN